MAKRKFHKINPALKHLEILIGNWEMELSNASFLASIATKVKGPVSFEWIEAGAFLVMYMGNKQLPSALWLIGKDDTTQDYKAFYYDDRKVSRIYEMSFSKRVWRLWRNAPGFFQRFKGKLSKNGNIITAKWEKSFDDGKKWEHDFDVTYTRR